MSAFDRLATTVASTERNPAPDANGLIGEPVENLSSVACLPLMPVDADLQAGSIQSAPFEVWETYANNALDIKQGDIFIVSATSYRVRAVENWPWVGGGTYLRLVLEEVKTQ